MQATSHIVLVRPNSFGYNAETAASNAFQNSLLLKNDNVMQQVAAEFDAFVMQLESEGVDVNVFEDTIDPVKPDAVFPNNWVTFHSDGTVILYPMLAPNRRLERRMDIINELRKKFNVRRVMDLSIYEKENRFLEGTGSIVFDHSNKVAYACISPRTDRELFVRVCDYLRYEPVYFYSFDAAGKEIYHTNVMMCVGNGFAVICAESITDLQERKKVIDLLGKTHDIVEISYNQMNHFAGNMLALQSKNGQHLVALSHSAFESLSPEQRTTIEKHAKLIPLKIPTIETIGGGSARCMIAEMFLEPIASPVD